MTKKQNTGLIIKGIMLLLALIVMIFVACLAWFATSDIPNVATGVQAKTIGVAEFDMAIGFKTSVNGYQYTMSDYVKTMNFSNVKCGDVYYDALHDFSPVDVTGDGVTLIRPSMTAKNADIDRTSTVYTTVTPNKEYISFDMYFRSNDPCSVYLDSDSYAIGAVEETPGDGNLIQTEATDTNRKSSDGDYSCDAVVGAVRVSFVEYSTVNEAEDLDNRATTPTLLWLPRPDIHLSTPIGDTWFLTTDVEPNQFLDTYGDMTCDTYTHHYYAFVDGVGTDINYANTVTETNTDIICTVDEIHDDGYYYGKTQVNIWIEGCDTEARRTISGGQFLVNFDLRGG